jgi:hypothetical protein
VRRGGVRFVALAGVGHRLRASRPLTPLVGGRRGHGAIRSAPELRRPGEILLTRRPRGVLALCRILPRPPRPGDLDRTLRRVALDQREQVEGCRRRDSVRALGRNWCRNEAANDCLEFGYLFHDVHTLLNSAMQTYHRYGGRWKYRGRQKNTDLCP